HEALRTTFASQEGEPVQVIRPAADVPVALVALTLLSGAAREAELQQALRREAVRPFDLTAGPLLRALLVRLAPEEHVLLLTIHHIVADGWSMGVLLEELATLYGAFAAGRPSQLVPLAIQYADYAVWQRAWLDGGETERQLAFWKERIAGAPAMLELPTDRPRPAVQTFRGALLPVVLPTELASGLAALSRVEGATLFMALLAGFQALLARLSGQSDVVVGAPVAGRTRTETEALIGFFVNTLPHRTDLSDDPTFRELLARVRAGALGAFSHQDLPLQHLVEELQPQRDPSHIPLFQVVFALQNDLAAAKELSGLTFDPLTVDTGTAKFDLALTLEERPDGLVGGVEYNTDLFDRSSIERLMAYFQRLLTEAVADPDRRIGTLNLLSADERRQILAGWNDTVAPYPDTMLIHELVAARAAEEPERVAVVWGEERLTYAELDCRANQVAHHLRRSGLGPYKLVGVCMERSPEMLVALLGTLKAGAAYLPIDPAYPPERIAFMLADAGVGVLLTQERLQMSADSVPVICLDSGWAAIAEESHAAPESLAGPENLAYVIYTSGSTGRPKGVMIEHRALLNLVYWHQSAFALTAADRTTQIAGVAFDAAVWEIWPSLAAGATLYLPDEETRLTPARLRDWLVANQITVSFLATPLAEQILTLGWPAETALRFLLTGGDKLHIYPPAGLAFQLINCYGPTESTVVATAAAIAAQAGTAGAPPIGRPIANTRVYLLDPSLQPTPVGVIGELYIGGSSLARGYLNRPDLTAERFLETAYGRLYRTGDLARYRPDGSIEYIGRSDHQVKIRGFRIELGEIETLLTQEEAVQAAVVVARAEQPGRKQLVAYVVPEKDHLVTPEALRLFLKQQLPDYMLPAAFVILAELPLTANGKIDRGALPAPEVLTASEAHAAPRTPLEAALMGIWCEVLGVGRVGIDDNFFALGGHSLLAVKLLARIQAEFGVELPLRALFTHPTVADLAPVIADSAPDAATAALPTGVHADAQAVGPAPLSSAQRRLWFLDQFEPDSAVYNVPFALRLTGSLDVDALTRSLNAIVQRHEALRTTFAAGEGGEPVQIVAPRIDLPLPLTDLSDYPDPESEAGDRARAEACRPFDLSTGPLLRAALLRLEPTDHLLLLNLHHIVADVLSMGVLFHELTVFYRAHTEGIPAVLPRLTMQYPDYARWQRQRLEGDRLADQLAYWQERLAGAPTALDLPTDRPRPPVKTYAGANLRTRFTPELAAALQRVSRQEGVTLYMTLLAAFQVLLRRSSGQTDLCVGTPVAGRPRQELEELIGLFISTLVIRTDLSGNPTFRAVLAQVRENVLGDFAHQELPFEHLVEALQPVRDTSRSPLFQVMFAAQTAEPLELPGLTVRTAEVENGTAKFDLTLHIAEEDGALTATMEYNTDLFDRATMERMMGHYVTLLAAAVADPDQPVESLPLMPPAEQHLILEQWSQTGPGHVDGQTVAALLNEQIRRLPSATALIAEEQRFTYAELHQRANRLAHYLQSQGVGPDVLVGVSLPRSPELVMALLAVVKAGGAYVPLDPNYPAERLAYMISESGLRLVIDPTWLERNAEAIAACPGRNPTVAVEPENLIYVIYTSGSTGRPKGVAITHRSVAELIYWVRANYTDEELSGVLFATSVSFDISVFELFGTLCCGGTLILAENALQLPALPAAGEVRLINTVPSAARELVRQQAIPPSVITVNLCGEALPRSLVRDLYALPNVRKVLNLYGPTEDTVYSTWSVVDRDGEQAPPIGRALPGTRVYILDQHLQPVPCGVPGELYLGGRGLARGYLHRPELTAERFPTTEFGRLYRTGDLVRWLPDGQMEFLGRIDHQVKIRGFRIELGEVQETLLTHPKVKEAVVVARSDSGDLRLVAYFAAESDLSVQELRALLGKRLPEYMIPSAFVQMAELPHTPNGKVDRKALPAPEWEQPSSSVAPRTEAEERLAALWCAVLHLNAVGVEDNFFELGGHSLLAAQLITRIRSEFGMELPLRAVFAHPTVAELAATIAGPAPEPVPVPV
ncbi:MAG: amino acid adenylation domain-containing protein, partial [Mycobacterium leprae]